MPRLYYVPESEFNDDLTTAGSLVTLKDLSYRFDSMIEEVPFQWAQALHLVTRLTSKSYSLIIVRWKMTIYGLVHVNPSS